MSATSLREIPADGAPPGALVDEAVAALERGGVVALPTETVYGLAVRADHPEALRRLEALKGRDAAQSFTWHAPSAERALTAFPELPHLVGRLAERYWPGPLTLVLHGSPPGLEQVAREGWTGVRVPAQEGTRAILAAADFPLVLSSANRTGEPPLAEAGAVQDAFEGELELVLDGGPSRLAESSTVLRVGTGHFDVLREGLIELEDLRRAAGLSLLFVCTGNTCRSPMAEAQARALLTERLGADPTRFGFSLGSAGVYAGAGSHASEHAVSAMAELSIDLEGHRSQSVRSERIAAADHVYCLTSGHRDALVAALPPGDAEHVELLDPEERDVPDPMGGDLEEYRHCAAVIREAIEARLASWV